MTLAKEKIVVGFPHGLGDFILASGVFAALRKKHPESHIIFACNLYLVTQRLLDRYKLFDQIIPMPNPWASSCSGIYDIDSWFNACNRIAAHVDADRVMMVDHREAHGYNHAIPLTAIAIGLDPNTSYDLPEFPVSEQELLEAQNIKDEFIRDKRYHFQHIHSSDARKNGAANYFSNKRGKGDLHLIDITRLQNCTSMSLGAAATLLRDASKITLVDSVFVHIAASFKLPINYHITSDKIDAQKKPPGLIVYNRTLIPEIPDYISIFSNLLQKFYVFSSRYLSKIRRIYALVTFRFNNALNRKNGKNTQYQINYITFHDTLNILPIKNKLVKFEDYESNLVLYFSLGEWYLFIEYLNSQKFTGIKILKICNEINSMLYGD